MVWSGAIPRIVWILICLQNFPKFHFCAATFLTCRMLQISHILNFRAPKGRTSGEFHQEHVWIGRIPNSPGPDIPDICNQAGPLLIQFHDAKQETGRAHGHWQQKHSTWDFFYFPRNPKSLRQQEMHGNKMCHVSVTLDPFHLRIQIPNDYFLCGQSQQAPKRRKQFPTPSCK